MVMNIEKKKMIIDFVEGCKKNNMDIENNGMKELIQCFFDDEDKNNYKFSYSYKLNYENNKEFWYADYCFDLDDIEYLNNYIEGKIFWNEELDNGKYKKYWEDREDKKFIEVVGLNIVNSDYENVY